MSLMITYREVNGPALAALKARQQAPVQAIPTMWDDWNHNCMGRGGNVGPALGWHLLVAGKSGEGKTYVAVNAAAHAVAAGEGVAFHSLEMDWDELVTRVLAINSGEAAYQLNPGKHFDPMAFDRAQRAMERARGLLVVNDEPLFKLNDVVDGIRRMYEQHGCRLHVIDYLQLAWTGDAGSLMERITEVSHAVRQLAKELRIVTLCLSQFNRETSKERDQRPQKEGMIGGSALENDSDQTVLLDHSRKVITRDPAGRALGWIGWALLDKNRHGPAVDIPIEFEARTGRLRQRLPDEVQDWELPKPKEKGR